MILKYKSWVIDKLSLLGLLSASRIVNYGKALLSFRLSVITKKVNVWAGPYALHFETASICNLHCPECIAGAGKINRSQNLLPLKVIEQKLFYHKDHAFYCNLYFQGEPFLNPEIYSSIKKASDYNYYSVISTNGHFLTPENCEKIIENGLAKIIISLDGIDSASYSEYRKGGNFDRVVKGISELAFAKQRLNSHKPFVVVQFLVNKTNENQLRKARRYIKKLGADQLDFKSMQIYSEEGREKFVPTTSKFNRYKHSTRPAIRKGCFRLWSDMIYTSDGTIVPCCYDKVPEYEMNNINDDTWSSDVFNSFRQRQLSGKNTPSICSNCHP
jgi:MoaA/NifB/PqqE/SkfB family radical SAM enzyme